MHIAFESSFTPIRLCNWEVPKYYPCDFPRTRKGKTTIISNDQGVILPNVPRSHKNPFDTYLGTWDMPKKITRAIAAELNGSNLLAEKKKKCYCVRGKKKKVTKKCPFKDLPAEVQDAFNECICNQETVEEEEVKTKDNKRKASPYVPGDILEGKNNLSGDLIKEEIKTSAQGFPKHLDDFSAKPEEPEKPITRKDVEEIYKKNQELKKTMYKPPDRPKSNKKTIATPILEALKNFHFAKRLHRENLEHDPLPDTITDRMYQKMQMQKDGPPPGLALQNDYYASAVGWKGHPGYGPTRCTKLKVYRPKTCVQPEPHKQNRPSSSICSFDLKWRFLRQKKVTPIELAICWDLVPENPKDEPNPPTHIDGSNGSVAPAVFSLVHTPKQEYRDEGVRCDGIRTGGIFERLSPTVPTDRNFIMDRPKTCAPTRRPSKESVASSKNSFFERKKTRPPSPISVSSDEEEVKEISKNKRAKSAYNINNNEPNKELCKNCINDDIYKSTPNLAECCFHQKCMNKRLCMACELKKMSINDKQKPKSEYKMAFKAGVPQKRVSKHLCRARLEFKVPKQKNPYSPRRYVIYSLAPPFSLQRDKRHEYPEHWRLATVYQHSYKPIHCRKRPMLATVFK